MNQDRQNQQEEARRSRHEEHLAWRLRRLHQRIEEKQRKFEERQFARHNRHSFSQQQFSRHEAHLEQKLRRLHERLERKQRQFEERQRRIEERQSMRHLDFDIERKPKWYQVLFGTVSIFVFFSLCWTAAHYLTRLLDKYWTYGRLHTTVREYAAYVLSLFIFGLVIQLVGLIMRPKRRNMLNAFTMMIDAMQRMSKGDFNVHLEAHPRYAGQFSVLIRNLNRMANELGQLEQMRQEFISNVSHEIQSPLTAIKGFAQALQGNDLSPAQRQHYLEIIETESDRLSRLSDNLLKLTSLESAHHPYQPNSFRLDRQLRQLVLSCEPLWEAKQLELDIQLDETVLYADEELLNQAWSNLLHNSIKFTPQGGTLTIKLEKNEAHAAVTFSDTGIGIDEAHLPHLFERFFKVDRSRNRAAGGSGLGLSIVKKIIDMHAGTIKVASKLGVGTTFVVKLPLQHADTKPSP